MFRSLIRCIKRSIERFKEKRRFRYRAKHNIRDTEHGADVDLEDVIAAQLQLQERVGRSLSSTESIATAIRMSQRTRNSPSMGSFLESEEAAHASAAKQEQGGNSAPDQSVASAVLEMQSLTPRFIMNGKQDESPASVLTTSTASTAKGESPTPDADGVRESVDLSASMGPRRSSIFNPNREWI